MEDTDWRPSRCPLCGKMREARRTPVCNNPECTVYVDMSSTRRIGKPQPVEFYILRDWDGGGGTSNRPNGFIVNSKELADKWKDGITGADYISYSGILDQQLADIPKAKEMLARQKALAKLTPAEQKLLGLK